MSEEVWVHGDVLCRRCGYDSKEAVQRHVWQDGWESLECPRCRSYDCKPVHSDEDADEPQTYDFEVPDGLTVMSGAAVFDCSDQEGNPVAVVVGAEGIRKVETLGLLTYGLESVKEAFMAEGSEER